MKVVAIIQARMGSSRLPGKVLADVGGRSMLWRVCRRAGRAALVDQVVVATTLEPDDEQIADECALLQVPCFRGSAQDVLRRYDGAARAFEADAVVRITADCPLIDPKVIDLVVGAFLRTEKGGQAPFSGEGGQAPVAQRAASPPLLPFSYASNTLRRRWPRGLDTEVMTVAALERACREATEPYQRTHVTPYIYRHPELFRLLAVTPPSGGHHEGFGHGRWTVDLPEDLDFVRAVYARLGDDPSFSWRDVQRLLTREPALAELNRHVRQKQLVEG
jgi:spore coat polysaccharide biosynthesis protein SpsF